MSHPECAGSKSCRCETCTFEIVLNFHEKSILTYKIVSKHIKNMHIRWGFVEEKKKKWEQFGEEVGK